MRPDNPNIDDSTVMRPSIQMVRAKAAIQEIRDRLKQTQDAATAASTTGNGIPAQAFNIAATESPTKTIDRTMSAVSVSFQYDPTDANFSGVHIWATGYKGNSNPVAVTDATVSPVTFLMETTQENIVITVQAFGGGGAADFSGAPTTTVALDGVVSAPPAPSIATSLQPTTSGLQFSFNQITGLAADVIQSYRVYRNTTNTTVGASLIRTIVHDNKSSGFPVVVQDQLEQYQTFYYWVSAINTTGLESTLTAAQSGAVISGAVGAGGPGSNLVYNGDFSFWSAATGVKGAFESSARQDDLDHTGVQQQTPNGWTRNFDSISGGGALGEGVIYRTNTAGPGTSGQYWLVLQEAPLQSPGAVFGAVSDAFPVTQGVPYFFRADVWPGQSTGFPAHAQWWFRVFWYKATTDFSQGSADFISISDVVAGSTASGLGTYSKALISPTNAVYARVVFLHWWDGAVPATVWNLLVGNVTCTPLIASQQNANLNNVASGATLPTIAQSGTTKTITISAFTMQYGFGQVSYNSGSVTPGAYGTWYIYLDDPAFGGGSVTFIATATKSDITAADGRVYVGQITTLAGGGAGGSFCPLSGAPVRLYGKRDWWSKRVEPAETFIEVITESGRCGVFTPMHEMYCRRGLLPLTNWTIGDLALTEEGDERVVSLKPLHIPGATADCYEATKGHIYSAWGFISHNKNYY